jgi:hypothetical protein
MMPSLRLNNVNSMQKKNFLLSPEIFSLHTRFTNLLHPIHHPFTAVQEVVTSAHNERVLLQKFYTSCKRTPLLLIVVTIMFHIISILFTLFRKFSDRETGKLKKK